MLKLSGSTDDETSSVVHPSQVEVDVFKVPLSQLITTTPLSVMHSPFSSVVVHVVVNVVNDVHSGHDDVPEMMLVSMVEDTPGWLLDSDVDDTAGWAHDLEGLELEETSGTGFEDFDEEKSVTVVEQSDVDETLGNVSDGLEDTSGRVLECSEASEKSGQGFECFDVEDKSDCVFETSTEVSEHSETSECSEIDGTSGGFDEEGQNVIESEQSEQSDVDEWPGFVSEDFEVEWSGHGFEGSQVEETSDQVSEDFDGFDEDHSGVSERSEVEENSGTGLEGSDAEEWSGHGFETSEVNDTSGKDSEDLDADETSGCGFEDS